MRAWLSHKTNGPGVASLIIGLALAANGTVGGWILVVLGLALLAHSRR